MKFIKLHSRGGNYLVVAENVAWLRAAENGQTNVGIVGGQPLLVVGSIEEVAAQILAGAGADEAQAPAPPAPVQSAEVPVQPAATAPVEGPPAPVVEAAAPVLPEPAPAPRPPEPEPAPAPAVSKSPVPARPRVASARSASMWERPAASGAAASVTVKAGSQRMMGALD